ncbi:hypothetical protein Sarmat_01037 [Rickettsiales endosymbiont of Paramecium tredecaurelia]|uniref:hypothetical protein n=1 Tax=Candidatus Sarmatiella mevalonica TaxID=2770581 RepID=UPI0019220B41|nr:hypothetical protein [Candidatus Sarmatiella mevalonica]MBL3285168.1 hypothetical protein [Candidatus Sarmatiella mevalonica]
MYHENPYHKEFTKFFVAPDVIIESIKAMPFASPNHIEDLVKKNLQVIVDHHQSGYKKTHDMHHHKIRECHRKMHDLFRSLHQDQKKSSVEQIMAENRKHLEELTDYSVEMYRELAEHMLHNTKTAITRIGDNFIEFMNNSIQNSNAHNERKPTSEAEATIKTATKASAAQSGAQAKTASKTKAQTKTANKTKAKEVKVKDVKIKTKATPKKNVHQAKNPKHNITSISEHMPQTHFHPNT